MGSTRSCSTGSPRPIVRARWRGMTTTRAAHGARIWRRLFKRGYECQSPGIRGVRAEKVGARDEAVFLCRTLLNENPGVPGTAAKLTNVGKATIPPPLSVEPRAGPIRPGADLCGAFFHTSPMAVLQTSFGSLWQIAPDAKIPTCSRHR